MEREFVLAAQQMRNNSNNSILFIKRLQRFKTTATLQDLGSQSLIDKRSFYHSYLRIAQSQSQT
jgi:hypothetical protein